MYTRALLTDFYELTMAAGYLAQGKVSDTATFDLYYRRNPFKGGYGIAAGLENAVRSVVEEKFSDEDLSYLRSLKSSAGSPAFSQDFLRYLSSYKFTGRIRAVRKGLWSFRTNLSCRSAVI
jgi:nicotinate phosphoribosyltransferase